MKKILLFLRIPFLLEKVDSVSIFSNNNIINVKVQFTIKYNEIIVKWSKFPLNFSNLSDYQDRIEEKLLVVALVEARENKQRKIFNSFVVESIIIDLEISPEYQLGRKYRNKAFMNINKIFSLKFTEEMYQKI